MNEVVGDRESDALDEAALAAIDARVEHVPAVVVIDDAPGPGREVVPGSRRAGVERVREHAPGTQIAGDRVPDGGVLVAQRRLPERAWRLQIEDVVLAAVASEPEVPHPLVRKAKRHFGLQDAFRSASPLFSKR